MRAFQLTPEYDNLGQDEWRRNQSRRWLLELDEYELVNLKRLFDAVSGKTGEQIPVTAFNNGDWVGQIGFHLPTLPGHIQPNMRYPEAKS